MDAAPRARWSDIVPPYFNVAAFIAGAYILARPSGSGGVQRRAPSPVWALLQAQDDTDG